MGPPAAQLVAFARPIAQHNRPREPSVAALPTSPRLCYNLRAVERPMHVDADLCALRSESGERQRAAEHPISFCPVCSERLEPKRCKLVCRKCGYYLSCSDYY